MVIDASAIVAILQDEPERDAFIVKMVADPRRLVSPINLAEAHMLMRSRRSDAGVQKLDQLLSDWAPEIVPTDTAQLAAARMAFDRYGKGRHPAALNIADCFAYALARTSGEPLLFKGRDFALTDVLVA